MKRSMALGWGSWSGGALLALLGSGCGAAPPLGGAGLKPATVASSSVSGPSSTGTGGSLTTDPSGGSDTGCDTAAPRSVYYLDRDGDGFGTLDVLLCAGGPGYAEVGGDCDDASREVYPGAPESVCGVDSDCDGVAPDCRELSLEDAEHVVAGHFGTDVLGDLDGDGTLELRVLRDETLPDGSPGYMTFVVAGRDLRGVIDPAVRPLAQMLSPVRGPATAESYSFSAERVHDINGDGLDDFYMTGVNTVLFGPMTDGFNLETPHKMRPGARFVAGQGDLTADGSDDLLALIWTRSDDLPAVALVPGPLPSGDLDVREHSVLEIAYAGLPEQFSENDWGSWFESVGDTDGDGVAEVVVADMVDEYYVPNNIEYLHHFFDLDLRGRVTPDAAKVKLQGGRIAGIGDTDGDGYTDVIASNGDACPFDTCVLYGPLEPGGWTTNRSTRFMESSLGKLSDPMTEVGDVNGDGRAEILVMTYGADRPDFRYWNSIVPGGIGEGSFGVADIRGRISIGTSDGFIHSGGFYEEFPAVHGSFREPTDVDGDGLADLVVSVNLSDTSIFYGAELSL